MSESMQLNCYLQLLYRPSEDTPQSNMVSKPVLSRRLLFTAPFRGLIPSKLFLLFRMCH